jgi:arsenate reductase
MTSRTEPSASGGVTIFHNPACGTSRHVLSAIREAGHVPTVVEYLKVGWRRDQLESLLRRMDLAARDILRVRGTPAEALGLTAPSATDAQILDAMVVDPILVERPIVVSPKGAALCRPSGKVQALL